MLLLEYHIPVCNTYPEWCFVFVDHVGDEHQSVFLLMHGLPRVPFYLHAAFQTQALWRQCDQTLFRQSNIKRKCHNSCTQY